MPQVADVPAELYPEVDPSLTGHGAERRLSAESFRQRSLAWSKRRDRSLIAAQREALKKEEAQCTFVPNTRESAHSLGLEDDGSGQWHHRVIAAGDIHSRLYDDKRLERAKKRSAQKILQQRQEQFAKECTFKVRTPQIPTVTTLHFVRNPLTLGLAPPNMLRCYLTR